MVIMINLNQLISKFLTKSERIWVLQLRKLLVIFRQFLTYRLLNLEHCIKHSDRKLAQISEREELMVMWFSEKLILVLRHYDIPIRVVVLANGELQSLEALSSWLSFLNKYAHHVIYVSLFKGKIILNQLGTMRTSPPEYDTIEGKLKFSSNLIFQ
jgi:hypothetical protein